MLDAGLRVPRDVAVVGCGNLHFDKSLKVPLSSIDQQSVAIGERAGKLVLSLIESKVPPEMCHAGAECRTARVQQPESLTVFTLVSRRLVRDVFLLG